MKRTGFIGGSDVAAILGVHPYRTSLAVWAEKTGRVEHDETIGDRPAVAWGNRLERCIGDHWAKRYNCKLERRKSPCLVVHPGYPWFRGHVDALPYDHSALRIERVPNILEIKTAGIRQAGRWGPSESRDPAHVPIEYYIQVQAYLWAKTGAIVNAMDEIALNWTRCAIAVLIGGQDYRDYQFPADLELWEQFDRYLPEFWDKVQTETPPDPDYRDNSYMSTLYDRVSRETLLADNEVSAAVADLVKLKSVKRSNDKEIGEREARIKMYLTDHSHLVDSTGEVLATWKTNEVSRIDTKALKRDFPTIAEQVTKTTTERRFLLKAGDDD